MQVRQIRIENFDYPLPDERIALHPLEKRDSCRMLVANAVGKVRHAQFSDLPLFLRPDTLLIANETKVIRARLEFVKDTGARIEIFLLEPESPHDYALNFASTGGCSWTCLVGNRKRWKEGSLTKTLEIDGRETEFRATLEPGEKTVVKFTWSDSGLSFARILESAGNIPIPPYLKRESEESDTTDYQTVYSRIQGSVAAPTAGLHFTPELIKELKAAGHEFATVALHVGAGTFQPVKSEEIGGHPMHSEWISVSRHTMGRIIDALETGRDILAVGTTSVRTLESLPYLGALAEKLGNFSENMKVTQWMPYEEPYSRLDTLRALKALEGNMRATGRDTVEADTSIMIAPGVRWRIVNRLITNFHQPKSTLLLLVGSFLQPCASDADSAERPRWRTLYSEALAEGYRFLSYGDACLFTRGEQPVELPLSKSMALRAATIYAVKAPGELDGLVGCGAGDDVEYYVKALKTVCRSAREPEVPLQVYIGEGAAPLRFLTAFAASLPGANVEVSCAPGLRRRPLMPLVETLRGMGADIEFDAGEETWQLKIRGKKLSGGKVSVDGSFTSQFVSALLLASPLWEKPLEAEIAGESPVSRSYVRMTETMMERDIPLKLEADWSAAAFFFEYCMTSGKSVVIDGLTEPALSVQGDAAARALFSRFGVDTRRRGENRELTVLEYNPPSDCGPYTLNLSETPDLVPALAVALCYRRIPFRFTGIAHLRYKESDRLMALQTILVRLGYGVSIEREDLVFDGAFLPLEEFPVEVDPFGDHRIAMALHPLELAGMVRVEDRKAVSKSFPNFYQQFK